jgi:hypothetical protein
MVIERKVETLTRRNPVPSFAGLNSASAAGSRAKRANEKGKGTHLFSQLPRRQDSPSKLFLPARHCKQHEG